MNRADTQTVFNDARRARVSTMKRKANNDYASSLTRLNSVHDLEYVETA